MPEKRLERTRRNYRYEFAQMREEDKQRESVRRLAEFLELDPVRLGLVLAEKRPTFFERVRID